MFVPQGQQVTANTSRFAKEMMDDTTAESCHQGPLARAHQTQVARGLSKAGNCVSALACSAANDSYMISCTDYIIILVESWMLRKVHLYSIFVFRTRWCWQSYRTFREKTHIISDSVCETLRNIVSCCIILDVTPCFVCFGCSFIGTRCT